MNFPILKNDTHRVPVSRRIHSAGSLQLSISAPIPQRQTKLSSARVPLVSNGTVHKPRIIWNSQARTEPDTSHPLITTLSETKLLSPVRFRQNCAAGIWIRYHPLIKGRTWEQRHLGLPRDFEKQEWDNSWINSELQFEIDALHYYYIIVIEYWHGAVCKWFSTRKQSSCLMQNDDTIFKCTNVYRVFVSF